MQQTVSHLFIKQLAQWGVKRIYGVVGDAILPLMDELGKQSEIRFIQCRHETAAALMASAEAKLTGQPAVCVATSGPGAAQLVNGLADAQVDRVPVIAITGQVETYKLGGPYKQFIDQQNLFSAVSIRSELLVHPVSAIEILHRLYKTAIERKGVAHVAVCKDVWTKLTTVEPLPEAPPAWSAPAVDRVALSSGWELFQTAKKPLFLLGAGARTASRSIQSLAEATDAGICLSLAAKGCIDAHHPQVLGGLGEGGSTATLRALAEADLLVIFGASWFPKEFVPERLPIIQVDVHVESFHGRAGLLPIQCPAGEAAAAWSSRVREEGVDRSGWKKRIRRLHHEYRSEVQEYGSFLPEGRIEPQHVMACLSGLVQEEAIVTLDTGEHTVWFNRAFLATRQMPLFSGKWRTMGFGLPAGIAAKLVYPKRQVVSIVGDGGLMMTAGELMTLAEQNLGFPVIVMNNRSLGLEEVKMKQEGFAPFGTTLANPDFVRLAEAFGIESSLVTSTDQLEPVLSQALNGTKPVVVEIRLTPPTLRPISLEMFFQTQASRGYNGT